MRKGFIFSLDAFVAFTLALVAIYSLIFFSSIPSAYYTSLTQAHLLSQDVISALGNTKCTFPECDDNKTSVLQHIVFRSNDRENSASNFLGRLIPKQFGYKLEILEDSFVYDTKDDAASNHNKKVNKLVVSSYAVVFDYKNEARDVVNPYNYITCQGPPAESRDLCALPVPNYLLPDFEIKTVKLTVYS